MDNNTREKNNKILPLSMLILTTFIGLILLNMWFISNEPVESKIENECIYWEFKYVMGNRVKSVLLCNDDRIVRDGEILPLPAFYDSGREEISAQYKELLKDLPKQEKPE